MNSKLTKANSEKNSPPIIIEGSCLAFFAVFFYFAADASCWFSHN